MSRKEYLRYLKSYDWQVKRQRALKAADWRCQVCNSEISLEVHHRTYDNIGDEQPSDLTVLCHECHELFSKRRQNRPYGFLTRIGWVIEDLAP